MLSKNDEQRMLQWKRILGPMDESKMTYFMTATTFLWLINKVLQINNEASELSDELYNANKELARMHEVHDA